MNLMAKDYALCYAPVKTTSSYVHWFWHNTGVWRTDRNATGDTARQSSLQRAALRRAVKRIFVRHSALKSWSSAPLTVEADDRAWVARTVTVLHWSQQRWMETSFAMWRTRWTLVSPTVCTLKSLLDAVLKYFLEQSTMHFFLCKLSPASDVALSSVLRFHQDKLPWRHTCFMYSTCAKTVEFKHVFNWCKQK